LREKILP